MYSVLILNEHQALWFQDTKPEEELYDLEDDPYELNNLAENPEYQDKLQELRQKLVEWQEKYGDKGFIPETKMLRQMWPDLEQPVTERPVIANAGKTVQISCPIEGASIADQIRNAEGQDLYPGWQVYTQ